ncbi:MAG: hypothetical protein WCA22_04100 [Candidatus Binatus sp.]
MSTIIPGQNSMFIQKTPAIPDSTGTVRLSYPGISKVAKSGIDFFGTAIESGVFPEKGPTSYFAPGGSEFICTVTSLLVKRVAQLEARNIAAMPTRSELLSVWFVPPDR